MSMIRIQFGVLDISVCLNADAIDSTDADIKWYILDPIDAVRVICCSSFFAAVKWTEMGPHHLLNDLETGLWLDGLC